MTLQERFALAREVRQRKADERAAYLHANVCAGMPVQRAAYYAGVSRRTASRYLRRAG
jgi:transposase